jgi:hypothetical protein
MSGAVGTKVGYLRRVGDDEGDLDPQDHVFVVSIAVGGGRVGPSVDEGSVVEKAARGPISIGTGRGRSRRRRAAFPFLLLLPC